MVTLRSRTSGADRAIDGPSSLVQPSKSRSISQSFSRSSKSASSAAAVKAIQTEQSVLKKRKEDQNGNKDDIKSEKAAASNTKRQRKSKDEASVEPSSSAAKSSKKKVMAPPPEEEARPLLSRQEIEQATTVEYPRLPFNLDDAKRHLCNIDVRFRGMLDTIELKPYDEVADGRVRELDLFKTLVTSILGQQISWLAARAIVYRFVRLFDTSLPEKPDFDNMPREELPFPHPLDVCQSSDEALRSAGLSGAKARYVKDIAQRFSDGRLDARRIITLNEEECIADLVQIKGVGRWTAEMLLLFALRRGDILPVGDLGVQKGMVVFFTSDHNGPSVPSKKRKQPKGTKEESATSEDIHDPNEKVPVIEEHLSESQAEVEREIAGAEEHLLGPEVSFVKDEVDVTVSPLPDLPAGITSALLHSRREGKKAKGNVYLTASEMEALAQSWAPFRSLAVYMMWAIID